MARRPASSRGERVSAHLTLAIETSCDETSAAVLRGETELLGHVILSPDIHRLYGGVVAELASRLGVEMAPERIARAVSAGRGDALRERISSAAREV